MKKNEATAFLFAELGEPRKAPMKLEPRQAVLVEADKPLPTQRILGNIPSKSNSYIIVTIPGKAAPVDCPDCDGSNDVSSIKCKTCNGEGVIRLPGKKHASLAKSKNLLRYENDFFLQCNQYRNRMIEGFFEIEVDVFYPTQRSDLDNALKVLMDCLQKVKAYKNDNKCVRITANKFVDPENPRIEFFLTPRQAQPVTTTQDNF